MFWFFGPEDCGILAPPSGIEPTPPLGPPGKFLNLIFEPVVKELLNNINLVSLSFSLPSSSIIYQILGNFLSLPFPQSSHIFLRGLNEIMPSGINRTLSA